jgi:hypothetical protein
MSASDMLPGSLLREPAKPSAKVILPPELNESSPSIGAARKLAYIDLWLNQLDLYNRTAKSLAITPVVATPRLCMFDGMALLNGANRPLYDQVNGPDFWPITYRDADRLQTLQNRVTAIWAAQNEVAMVDIAGKAPRDPSLCADAVHDIPLSQRLRAWIIFQSFVPLILRDVAAGRIPRPSVEAVTRHPYGLDDPPLRLSRAEILDRYNPSTATMSVASLSIGGLVKGTPDASIVGENPVSITTSRGRFDYAARLEVPATLKKAGRAVFKIKIKVSSGSFNIALLSNDERDIISSQSVESKSDIETVDLVAPSLDQVGVVIFANNRRRDGLSSVAQLSSVEVFHSN